MPIFHNPSYNDTGVSFDTTRKADAIATGLLELPIPGVRIVDPVPATYSELCGIHDEEYVRAVRDGDPYYLAATNGLGWDERLFNAVCHSSGGVRSAALMALEHNTITGSLSSGLHHASPTQGNGYCTFNGLALAAHAALAAGAGRVLILDLDAHCGGGTAACIDGVDGIEQVDVSVNHFDSYTSRNDARLVVTDGVDYVNTIDRALDGIADPASIGLVLYNAGMDAHGDAGGSHHIGTDTIVQRERLVFEWASALGLPVAWVLAGGYTINIDMAGLVDLHRITITEAQRCITTEA